MKRPFSTIRGAWPPAGLIAIFVFGYAGMEFCLRLLQARMPYASAAISDMPEIVLIRKIMLCGAAAVYAAFRLVRFHPACYPGYAGWLRLTPWTSDRPLPLGPVHPGWQDAIVLAVIAVIANWHAGLDPALPVIIYSLVWLTGMTLLLVITRAWGACLILGFLWPAIFLPRMQGWSMGFLVAAIVATIASGYRASLCSFPWEYLMNPQRPNASGILGVQIDVTPGGLEQSGTPSLRNAGWPNQALAPEIRSKPIPPPATLWFSVLLGWWAYCLIVATDMPPLPAVILIFTIFTAAFRVLIYCSQVAPPFHVFGRIASGKFIVPGFDNVFVTPLVAVLVALAGGIIIGHSGRFYASVEAIVIGLIWLVLLSGGPTLRTWLLTGQHRYRQPSALTSKKHWLRKV
jgi:hypothetical protein